jgi:hypothetical protein
VTVEREGAFVKVRWLPATTGTAGWLAEFEET